jgi:hypothetical protein
LAQGSPAFHHFDQMTHHITRGMAAIDRLEAALHAGHADAAAHDIAELERFGAATGSPWAAAAAAHGRALLSDGREAERHFLTALDHHAASPRRFDRARTQLTYGEFLRRARRRVDARAHLRAALQVFSDLGAVSWADRAAQELRASGETARRRDPSAASELTHQELEVARLVAQGLSNREWRRACSSASAPSSSTCVTSSPSWASAPGRSWPRSTSARTSGRDVLVVPPARTRSPRVYRDNVPALPWTTVSSPSEPAGVCTIFAAQLPLRFHRHMPRLLWLTVRIRRQLPHVPGAAGLRLRPRDPPQDPLDQLRLVPSHRLGRLRPGPTAPDRETGPEKRHPSSHIRRVDLLNRSATRTLARDPRARLRAASERS